MYCQECGAKNPIASRFCMKCGTALTKVEPPKPAAAPFDAGPMELDRYEAPADAPTVVQPSQQPSWAPYELASQPFAGSHAHGAVGGEQAPEWAWPDEPDWVEQDHVAPAPVLPTQPAPARRRRFPRVLLSCGIVALILVLVLVAAVVAAWFWLGLHRVNQTVRIIPDDSPMVLSFSPDPRQVLNYRNVANLEALVPLLAVVPGLVDVADEAQSQSAADLNIDFQADILPWIGREASIAVLDAEVPGGTGAPSLLLSVATRNDARSDKFLAKMRAALEDEGFSFEEETYRGTRVVYQVPTQEGAFAPAFATTRHLVLVGTDLDTLHTAIDIAEGETEQVLANDEAYKAVMKQLPANRLGYVYVEGQTFLKQLAEVGDQTEDMQAIQGLGAAFGLSSRGITVDYVISYDTREMSGSHRQAMQRPPAERVTADLLPGSSVAYWSEQEAQLTWEGLMTTLRAVPDLEDALSEVDSTLDEIEAKTGFNIDDEVSSQMTGEYALALVQDNSGFPGAQDVPLGLVLMAEVNRPSSTRSTLDDLAQALARAGIVASFPERDRGTTYLDTGAGWYLAYGFVDDFLVIGSSPVAVEAAMKGQDDPISEAHLFREALQRLPKEASGYLFADAESIIDAILEAGSASDQDYYQRELEPYLESWQALGFSLGSMDDAGLVHGTLVLLTR